MTSESTVCEAKSQNTNEMIRSKQPLVISEVRGREDFIVTHQEVFMYS